MISRGRADLLYFLSIMSLEQSQVSHLVVFCLKVQHRAFVNPASPFADYLQVLFAAGPN